MVKIITANPCKNSDAPGAVLSYRVLMLRIKPALINMFLLRTLPLLRHNTGLLYGQSLLGAPVMQMLSQTS